jgi:hypothetical protein
MSGDGGERERPKTPRAARHSERAFFDLNYVGDDPSPANVAAARSSRDALAALFKKLEHADDMLTLDRSNPRAAALAALGAVIEFTARAAHVDEGRFSRPLELLRDELASLPTAEPGDVLPPIKGWSERRRVDRTVQAHAAYALWLLCGRIGERALGEADAAAAVAAVLEARGFPFGGRRDDKAAAVIAWGKLAMAQAAVDELNRLAAADIPFSYDRDALAQRRAVIRWLEGVLDRLGYEAV